jgi:hypothetical protein
MREYQEIQQKIIEKLEISILKEEKCIKDAFKLIPQKMIESKMLLSIHKILQEPSYCTTMLAKDC